MNDDSLIEFLRGQIPERTDAQLFAAFWPVFKKGAFAPTRSKRETEAEADGLRTLASEIESNPGSWLEARKKLPPWVTRQLEGWNPTTLTDPADVVSPPAEELRTMATHSETWQRLNPKTGGKDPEAHMLARAVGQAFTDLMLPVTFGTDRLDGRDPTTCFCRVVKRALKHHGFRVDWRQPARAAWNDFRGISQENSDA